jgi:hypothetical protein
MSQSPDEELDTQFMLNIADQLPESEREMLYTAGYKDGLVGQRGDALADYEGDHPLAASDVYLEGYVKGQKEAGH